MDNILSNKVFVSHEKFAFYFHTQKEKKRFLANLILYKVKCLFLTLVYSFHKKHKQCNFENIDDK